VSIGAVIIPVRMASTRLPGKPMAEINGKPLLWHVWERCTNAVGDERVVVAGCDDEVKEFCQQEGIKYTCTSRSCLTGTDRVAEAVDLLNLDFAVNVQGDEPLLEAADVRHVFERMQADQSVVLNCYSDLRSDEVLDPSVPKVAISLSGRLLYMSRGGIPYDKHISANALYKQVCIYGFSSNHLKIFKSVLGKTPVESVEDIEILRFLELDVGVQMIQVTPTPIAVDTQQDLEKARRLMSDGFVSK